MTEKSDSPPQDLAASPKTTAAGRRPYGSPTLRRYGAIRNLTSGGFGSNQEIGNKGEKKFP